MMRILVLAFAALSAGCGMRTPMLDRTGDEIDSRGARTPEADAQVGRADGGPVDALVTPDLEIRPTPDAILNQDLNLMPPPDAVSKPDRVADSGQDLPKPDLAADRAIFAPDLPADRTAPDLPVDRTAPDLPADRFDASTDTRADVPPDGQRDTLVPNPDTRDASQDVVADVERDTTPDSMPSDVIEVGGSPDGRGPGLWVLAGLLSGPGGLDGMGTAAQFYFPSGVATDGAGTLFIADAANNTIRKMVLSTGQVTTMAGSLGLTGSDDGIGASARFFSPQGLACDGAGNLYIADSVNSLIRKLVIATGEVTTIAGGNASAHRDGRGSEARFESPMALAYDGAGNLFVADMDNTIRKIVLSTADVTTLAGDATQSGSQDGNGAAAQFSRPAGIAWDGTGNLYVADSYNHAIRKIVAATGVVTTIAGTPGAEGTDDGIGSAARFSYPHGLSVEGGNLIVVDFGSNRIRQIVLATAAVSTLAGNSGLAGYNDGPGDLAEFNDPDFVAGDGAGNLLVTEAGNHAVRKIVMATRTVTTLAGRRLDSSAGSDDGLGEVARFRSPMGLVGDNLGNLFVADSGNQTIRTIAGATGAVTTLAGLAGKVGSQNGTGTDARFNFPVALAYDGTGALLVADQADQVIRKIVLATAAVTTLAGSSGIAGRDDGTGTNARFSSPSALAVDSAGNLFVADRDMHTIRKLELASGAVTTLAGSAGLAGSDDGVRASARFSSPTGLACDQAGNLYVADTGNYTIRKIEINSGRVTTLAGFAGAADATDGMGPAARFLAPGAMTTDGAGNLLVADGEDNAVRRVNLSTGMVTTVVGTARRWETIPGPLPAYMATPAGLAVLPSGELAITDRAEHAVLIAHF